MPQQVKISPCPRPGNDLNLQPWLENLSMGNARNMKITAYNLEVLMGAVRLRDITIDCYEAKIK